MSPSKQAEILASTGLAFASGACAGYYAKHAGARGIMIAVAFGLTVAIVGIFYSRWLRKRLIVLEVSEARPTMGPPEDLRIAITNISDDPITVVDAWIQLDRENKIPVLTNVVGVFPVKIPGYGGVWVWRFKKRNLPDGFNCEKMVRARLMDGRILESRRGDPPPPSWVT